MDSELHLKWDLVTYYAAEAFESNYRLTAYKDGYMVQTLLGDKLVMVTGEDLGFKHYRELAAEWLMAHLQSKHES